MLVRLFSSLVCTWFLPDAAWACLGGLFGSSGPVCPNIVTDTAFDLQRFTGQWHAVYTTNENEAKNVKCSNIYFSQVNDGLLAFFENLTNSVQTTGGKKFKQDSSLKHNFEVTNAGACGFTSATPPTETIITDYQSYAMLYSCTVTGKEYVEAALLLSRTTALSDDLKAKLTERKQFQLFSLLQTGCGC